MPPVVRILKLLAALVAFALYVWAGAVHALPHVRARKRLRRIRTPVLRRDA